MRRMRKRPSARVRAIDPGNRIEEAVPTGGGTAFSAWAPRPPSRRKPADSA